MPMSDDQWSVRVEPAILLPGRPVSVTVAYIPTRDHPVRGVTIALRCVELYRYDRSETVSGGQSVTHVRTVTHTAEEELVRLETVVAGPTRFIAGQTETWHVTFDVPGLGPATFEGEELRCTWTLSAVIDIALAIDERIDQSVPVAQPTALLRAGVIDVDQYGLFEEAPVNLDAHPAQVRLKPVPINLQAAFSGGFTVETPAPISVQEVRLELRVKADVIVSGGRHEEIVVWRGGLPTDGRVFGGAMAEHRFEVPACGAWMPTIDLPHGRARGDFHVILALSWKPDIHYVRDVALATTAEL